MDNFGYFLLPPFVRYRDGRYGKYPIFVIPLKSYTDIIGTDANYTFATQALSQTQKNVSEPQTGVELTTF